MVVRIPDERIPKGIRISTSRLWVGVAALLVCLAQPGHAAQASAGDTLPPWEPTVEIAIEVLNMVAARWSVSSSDLHLEWARPRDGVEIPEVARVEILGGGRSGQWIATFETFGADPKKGSPSLSGPVSPGSSLSHANRWPGVMFSTPETWTLCLSSTGALLRNFLSQSKPDGSLRGGSRPGML